MLRNITIALSRVRGLRRVTESVQKLYAQRDVAFTIHDLDGNIAFSSRFSSHIGSSIYWRGSYARGILRVLDAILKPDMTVYDVGANEGEETLFCAKRVAKVVAFEPSPIVFPMLRHNVELNGFSNVELRQFGLSDEEATIPFYAPAERGSDGTYNYGMGTTLPEAKVKQAGSIKVVPLDSLKPERLDLIKIDVEGAEMSVLQGALLTIRRFHPVIICETWETTRKPILNLLQQAEYRVQGITEEGEFCAAEKARDVLATS